MSKYSYVGSRPLRRLLLSFAVLLLPGCAGSMQLFEDGLAAMRGEGGTIARSDQLAPTVEHVRSLAARRPASAWEAAVPHESADLLQFIDERRLLVGHVEVDAYLARPSYKELVLYDATSGETLWQAPREHIPKGQYSVIAVQPLIVLLGRSEAVLRLSALDPATGETRWNGAYQGAIAQGISDDGARFFLLAAADPAPRLLAIDLANGQELWSSALPEGSVGESGQAQLLVEDRAIYVVGSMLLRFDGAGGRLSWQADVDEIGGAAPVPGGIIAWNAKSIALLDAGNGRERWRHAVRRGGIKLVSASARDITLVLAPETADIATGPLPTDRIEALDLKSGRSRWVQDTGGTVVSTVVHDQGLVLCALEEAVLGLNARSGARRFRTALPAAFRVAAPTNYVPAGQPDLLHLRADKLYLSREAAGLATFALPSGKLLWRQGNIALDARSYPFSTPVRVQRLRVTLAMNGAAVSEGPVDASYFYRPTPSFQMQSLQREYNALAFERQRALGRGDSARAGWVSEQMSVNLKMQSFNQSMEAAQQILGSAVALSSAIESTLKNEALNGAVDRMTMEINRAARLHREAFHGRYWLRPYVDAVNDKVLGVTVVNLDTGRRHDLMTSAFIQAYSQNSIELPPLALDPSGERLYTVGVGLNPERYLPHVLWKVRLPQPSLLAYDLRRLAFTPRNPAVEKRLALAESAHAGRDQQLLDAVLMNNLVTVRRLLDAGVDPNVRTVHGYTPLMVAADSGGETMVRLLLGRGASVKSTVLGQSARDFAANPDIEKLLAEAGAPKGEPLPVARGPVLDSGELIDGTYQPSILTAYAAESGEEVALVATPAGPAMMARAGNQGVLYRTHWRDEHGDHFAMTINLPTGQGAAYEFIVPTDRGRAAMMLTFPPGSYNSIELDNGAGRRPLPRPAALYQRYLLMPQAQ